MNSTDFVEKIKGMLISWIIFAVTLFVIFNFYQKQNEQIDKIKESQNIEIKKVSLLKKIQATHQELEAYKKLLTKVLEDSVISSLSGFAKVFNVQVESFKPEAKKLNKDYVEFPFTLLVKANGYHDLARFISRIESYPQVFIITNLDINSVDNRESNITARLTLSNIVFLGNENDKK